MKKLMAILLAVALVATLSISAVMTASAGSDPKIVVSSATATKGETKDITISFADNDAGIASAKLSVAFPSDLTLTKVTYSNSLKTSDPDDPETSTSQTSKPAKLTSPVTLNWVSYSQNVTGNIVYATLTFTVASEATEGDKNIEVSYESGNIFRYSSGTYATQDLVEANVDPSITNGKITVVSCLHANTTVVPAVASTCKTAGHAEYTKCDDCGAVVSGSDAALPLDPTNHEGDTEVRDAKPATCSEKGYTGDTYCKACNTMITKGEDIATTAHTEASTWSYDANNHWKICTACDWIFEDSKAAHSGGTATCTKKAVCAVCGQEYGDVDANNHGATEVRDAKAATCSEKGYTGDTYCKDCGVMISKGKDIDTIAHTEASTWSYNSASHWKECTECKQVIGESASHDYEEKVLKEATTEEAGSKANVCKVCGYTDEQSVTEIPKLISYDVTDADGKKDGDAVVFDGTDAEDVSITAAFPKSKFTGVKVNGKEVPSDAYELTEDEKGNTKVVFKDEYLKTLAEGNATVEILADDGVATFNVTVKNTAAANNNGSSENTSPVTGDSDIFFLVALLLAVMAVSVFTGYTYRRRKEND